MNSYKSYDKLLMEKEKKETCLPKWQVYIKRYSNFLIEPFSPRVKSYGNAMCDNKM